MASKNVPQTTPGWLKFLRYAFVFLVLFFLLFGTQLVRIYTDWQWFGELHQRIVFYKSIDAKLLLFFGFGALFFIIVYVNIWLAIKFCESRSIIRMMHDDRVQFTDAAKGVVRWGALAGCILLSFLVGGNASTHWSEYLLYHHHIPFGVTDPLFHLDIGFYVFRLPFLDYIQGLALFTVGCAAVGAFAVHYIYNTIDFLGSGSAPIASFVRKHILALLTVFAVIFAWGILLGRYDLLTNDNGVYFGAGYTDIHARLPAANISAVVMLIVAILCLVNIWVGRPFRLPIAGFGAWVVIAFLAGGIWPSLMQRFTVVPNQFGMEKPYIAYDIKYTQQAYGLSNVQVLPFSGVKPADANVLKENEATIKNIRLWDWPQLGAVYTAKQARQTYYTFNLSANPNSGATGFDIDVDRYHLGGEYRQVMLAAREMNQAGLPNSAQTWQNQRLQYTHGYGVVMSPVNEVDSDGLPSYFLSQIPVQSSIPGFNVTVPQIYYGQLNNSYVLVDTKQQEFDYPSGDKNVMTQYDGTGGIKLGGIVNRTIWALRTGDANLLLSTDLTDSSKILFRRNIRNRVETLAPFLNWDNDPYLVVDNGRLVWIMDAYTVTDRYPYSKSTEVGTGIDGVDQVFNYIRNSVKAVVDAYNGSVTFYVSDMNDPIIKAWAQIFPGLLVPMSQMPPDLVQHIRYPEDMFRFQRNIYTIYHINDPLEYYQKNDAWMVPPDPTASPDTTDTSGVMGMENSQVRMQPYYIIMRLPGEKHEEFMIMSPFTYLSIPNMSAWMCAKCDPGDYGHLLVYRFPKNSTINGPGNIMAQINSQPEISQFRTLQNQQGSHVLFGNMLVIPMNSSIVFAVPLYVQSTGSGSASVPEIREVILATGDRIVMRPTLEEAVAALPSAGSANQTSTQSAIIPANPMNANPSPHGGTVKDMIKQLSGELQNAQAKQKEYNDALNRMSQTIQQLKSKVGSTP